MARGAPRGGVGPRTFRERPLDPARALPVLRALREVEDPRARAALRAVAAWGGGRGGHKGEGKGGDENAGGIPLPGVRFASPDRSSGQHWEPPQAYIRRSSEVQAGPGSGYDLESDDEEWLRSQPGWSQRAETSQKGSKGRRGRPKAASPSRLASLSPATFPGEGPLTEGQLESLLHLLDLATESLQAARRITADAALDALDWPVARRVLDRDLALEDAEAGVLRRGWEYYVEKRRRLGRPLVRALQVPPGKDDANPYNLFCGKKTPQKRDSRGRKKRAAQLPPAGGGATSHKKKVVERLPAFHVSTDTEVASELLPDAVPVVCGELQGLLLPNRPLREERIELPGGEVVTGAEFERRAGRGAHRRWKMSSKVSGVYVADWLRAAGAKPGRGREFVGSVVAILREGDFQPGVVDDFEVQGGQHHIRYADGRQEWCHVNMQSIRILAGRAEDHGVQVASSRCKDAAQLALETARNPPLLTVLTHTPEVMPRGTASGSRLSPRGDISATRSGDGTKSLVNWISRVVASVGRAHMAARTQGDESSLWPAQEPWPPLRRDHAVRRLLSGTPRADGAGAGRSIAVPAPAGDSDDRGAVQPELLHVICGTLRGTLLPGCRVREEKILCDGVEMTPAEFERLGGRANTKKWKKSIRVMLDGQKEGPRVGMWLRARGAELGQKAVGSRVGIFWPEDDVFYWGCLLDFNPTTGEHLLHYDDLEQEWLYLNLQLIKWEEGLAPAVGRLYAGGKAGAGGAVRRPLDVLNY